MTAFTVTYHLGPYAASVRVFARDAAEAIAVVQRQMLGTCGETWSAEAAS